jgi:hypothetical protein
MKSGKEKEEKERHLKSGHARNPEANFLVINLRSYGIT